MPPPEEGGGQRSATPAEESGRPAEAAPPLAHAPSVTEETQLKRPRRRMRRRSLSPLPWKSAAADSPLGCNHFQLRGVFFFLFSLLCPLPDFADSKLGIFLSCAREKGPQSSSGRTENSSA